MPQVNKSNPVGTKKNYVKRQIDTFYLLVLKPGLNLVLFQLTLLLNCLLIKQVLLLSFFDVVIITQVNIYSNRKDLFYYKTSPVNS